MPFVFARASVWQEPHLATNCCLPRIRLGLSAPLTEQPPAASASAPSRPPAPRAQRGREARAPRSAPRGRGRGASGAHERAEHYPKQPGGPRLLLAAPRVAPHGLGQTVQLALRRGDHARAPRPPRTSARAPSRRAPRGSATRSAGSACSQPTTRAASAATASSSIGNDSHRGRLAAGTAPRQRVAHLGEPRMGGADGQRRRTRPPRPRPCRRPRGRCSARPAPRTPAAARPAPRDPGGR